MLDLVPLGDMVHGFRCLGVGRRFGNCEGSRVYLFFLYLKL